MLWGRGCCWRAWQSSEERQRRGQGALSRILYTRTEAQRGAIPTLAYPSHPVWALIMQGRTQGRTVARCHVGGEMGGVGCSIRWKLVDSRYLVA